MCGIAGIYNIDSKPVDLDILKKFTRSLAHRGPDGEGFFLNKDKNIGIGHRRLSVIDITNLSSQPMTYSDGRYVITYNGEIYNYLEIREELKSKGYNFRTNGDTEVVLISYIHWKEKCNFKFNGMWAFAIWDNLEKKLFLSRDRFGVKPLYYYKKNNSVFFASELKSFMYLNNDSPELNISNFYSLNKDHNRRDTFLKNVFLLGPGQTMVVDQNKSISFNKWWSTINNTRQVNKSFDDQIDEFKEIFFDSLKLRMRSDVKIATSLSGGLDSSSIVASLDYLKKNNHINSNHAHNVYILDYVNEINSETKYAKSLIKNISVVPKIIKIEKNDFTAEEIIKSTYHQEMIGDDAIGPWNIYKYMKQDNIKVSLDGHGPDELIGGYWDAPMSARSDLNIFLNPIRYLDLTLLYSRMNNSRLEKKSLIYLILNKIIDRFNTPTQNEYEKNYNFFLHDNINPSYFEEDEIQDMNNFQKILYKQFHSGGFQKIINKFDKISMAHGIESRCPFLDWRLVTFLFSIPSTSKIGNHLTKKILRYSMQDILPNNIRKRINKKGFTADYLWFQNNFKDFIKDTVCNKDFIKSDVFDGNRIKQIVFSSENYNLKKIFRYIQVYYLIKEFKVQCNI